MTADEFLVALRTELQAEFAPLRERLQKVEVRLATIGDGLTGVRAELMPMRAQLDGLPLMNRRLNVVQQETRLLRAAFDEFARTNVTADEIDALHADVNRVQAEEIELGTRLATVERLQAGQTELAARVATVERMLEELRNK
jgi:hypothetical protein